MARRCSFIAFWPHLSQGLCLGRPPEMLPSSLAGGPWGTYMPATPREKKLEIALVKLRAFQVANVSLGLPAKLVGTRCAALPLTEQLKTQP